MSLTEIRSTDTWRLTGRLDDSSPLIDVRISPYPFVIGRRAKTSLTISRSTVSSKHAELFERDHQLWLRDLGSTNGTFVNGEQVTGERSVRQGDLLQFADFPFRLGRDQASEEMHTLLRSDDVCDQALALIQLDKLMASREVLPHFQPIVSLEDRAAVGYEVLGRSRFFGLKTPKELFLAASQLSLEGELSRMFRIAGVSEGVLLPDSPILFLNTHPVELEDAQLHDSLRELRDLHPLQPIVVELHEAAVTNLQKMQQLRDELKQLDIQLAYDDFGAGQSRLFELATVQPDYLKFDMCLIQGIHEAPAQQRQMLATLVKMTRELGICPIAEGVESPAEDAVCRELGFVLGQGFLYGRPAPSPKIEKKSP